VFEPKTPMTRGLVWCRQSNLLTDELVVDKEWKSQIRRKEFSILGVDRDVKVHTFDIQSQDVVLCPDGGLDHAQILVGRLVLDRCLVETEVVMNDTMFVLARRMWSVNLYLEKNCSSFRARS
jgi:hypothetical protein